MKKLLPIVVVAAMLVAACGQSYEDTKRLTRKQRQEAFRRDSAALKLAVMPTLDCLPLYVAEHYGLLDTLHGGVRLKQYMAQMDCDTAFERGRVEGVMTDLVRARMMERRGTKVRYVSATAAHWQLISNRNARVRQLKQLDDKMVAMTRQSATDVLTDRVLDSVKLNADRVFKVQVNDVAVRMLMLQNNEMDALWLAEPLATVARTLKHVVVYDTRKEDVRLGALVFHEQEMQRKERAQQLKLLLKAYDRGVDSVNKHGVRYYRGLIAKRCRVKPAMIDSLPADIKYEHVAEPRQQDVAWVDKWMKK